MSGLDREWSARCVLRNVIKFVEESTAYVAEITLCTLFYVSLMESLSSLLVVKCVFSTYRAFNEHRILLMLTAASVCLATIGKIIEKQSRMKKASRLLILLCSFSGGIIPLVSNITFNDWSCLVDAEHLRWYRKNYDVVMPVPPSPVGNTEEEEPTNICVFYTNHCYLQHFRFQCDIIYTWTTVSWAFFICIFIYFTMRFCGIRCNPKIWSRSSSAISPEIQDITAQVNLSSDQGIASRVHSSSDSSKVPPAFIELCDGSIYSPAEDMYYRPCQTACTTRSTSHHVEQEYRTERDSYYSTYNLEREIQTRYGVDIPPCRAESEIQTDFDDFDVDSAEVEVVKNVPEPMYHPLSSIIDLKSTPITKYKMDLPSETSSCSTSTETSSLKCSLCTRDLTEYYAQLENPDAPKRASICMKCPNCGHYFYPRFSK